MEKTEIFSAKQRSRSPMIISFGERTPNGLRERVSRGGEVFLAPEHSLLREYVRTFAEREICPYVATIETRQTVEHDLAKKIVRQGWTGVTIPKEYGGMGMGHLAKTLIIEELARVNAAMGAVLQASTLGVAKVLHFGTEHQKREWLPRFASGELIPTIAMTEPDSGGHILGMESAAIKKGNEYVLNGKKWLVGDSHIGDVHGVVLRTGPGKRGLTAFLVEKDRPGFRLGEPGNQSGLHGFSFGEIIFEDCVLPEANRIGDEGQGMEVAYSSSLLYGRPNVTAVALGISQAILEDTLNFCLERSLYGKPLSELPTIQAKIGEIFANLQSTRTMAYLATHLLDAKQGADSELMTAKLLSTEGAFVAAKYAIDIFAGRGTMREYRIERYLRDSYHTLSPAGTSDIQRLRLAEIAFGKEKGSWSEKLSHVISVNRSSRGTLSHSSLLEEF